jgi:hypothetical protein
MKRASYLYIVMRLAGAVTAAASLTPAANAQSPSGRDDRLALMASGATLTGTDGGWGASTLWLHNFNANTILGLGGEHQSIADARWNFGRLTFNYGFGQAPERTNLYFEVAEGRGHDHVHDYDYSILTAGLYQNITKQWILQLEDKQIKVDTVEGNLPKVGVQYWWGPRVATSVAYAYSTKPSLDTQLATARIDASIKRVSLFAGLGNGQASPIAVGSPIAILGPLPSVGYHQYYAGFGQTFSRVDTTVVLDFTRLGKTSDHWTLTFNALLHKRTGAAR